MRSAAVAGDRIGCLGATDCAAAIAGDESLQRRQIVQVRQIDLAPRFDRSLEAVQCQPCAIGDSIVDPAIDLEGREQKVPHAQAVFTCQANPPRRRTDGLRTAPPAPVIHRLQRFPKDGEDRRQGGTLGRRQRVHQPFVLGATADADGVVDVQVAAEQ